MTDHSSSDSIHAAVLAERQRMERAYAAQVRGFEIDGPRRQASGRIGASWLELLHDPASYGIAALAVLWLVIFLFPIASLPPWQAGRNLATAVEKNDLLESQVARLSKERQKLTTEKAEIERKGNERVLTAETKTKEAEANLKQSQAQEAKLREALNELAKKNPGPETNNIMRHVQQAIPKKP